MAFESLYKTINDQRRYNDRSGSYWASSSNEKIIIWVKLNRCYSMRGYRWKFMVHHPVPESIRHYGPRNSQNHVWYNWVWPAEYRIWNYLRNIDEKWNEDVKVEDGLVLTSKDVLEAASFAVCIHDADVASFYADSDEWIQIFVIQLSYLNINFMKFDKGLYSSYRIHYAPFEHLIYIYIRLFDKSQTKRWNFTYSKNREKKI